MVDVKREFGKKKEKGSEDLGCGYLGTFQLDEKKGFLPLQEYSYDEAKELLFQLLIIGYFTDEEKILARKCFEYYGLDVEKIEKELEEVEQGGSDEHSAITG